MGNRTRDGLAVVLTDVVARSARAAGYRATTLPGVVAERLSPRITSRIAAAAPAVVVVSGTNGKTTTTRLIVDLLEAAGRRTISNPSGANLLAGVTSMFIAHRAELSAADAPIVVLEVDEMSLDRVASQVPIHVLVATNLVRDQLDRYGETDAVTQRWRPVIRDLVAESTLVVCADDPRLMHLAAGATARTQTFGLAEAPAESSADPALTPEAVACPACDGPLARRWVGLGHLGDFTCTRCSFERKRPSIAVRVGESHDFAETHMTLLDAASGTEQSLTLAMPGVSNAYNAVAAVTAVVALGVPFRSAAESLSGLRPPWGRYERLDIDGREVILSLGKNPASVAELVRIGASADVDTVVVGVNDAVADGRDASWYWDVDLAPLFAGRQFLLTGTRRLDLALRLKYSAVYAQHTSSPADATVDSPADALSRMVAATPPGGRVFVVLTYTALLELRSALAARMLLSPMPA